MKILLKIGKIVCRRKLAILAIFLYIHSLTPLNIMEQVYGHCCTSPRLREPSWNFRDPQMDPRMYTMRLILGVPCRFFKWTRRKVPKIKKFKKGHKCTPRNFFEVQKFWFQPWESKQLTLLNLSFPVLCFLNLHEEKFVN